ncbi:MAG: glycosyl hydrolase 2 galactose-binding domain-containing protein [Huintestinicola sp.]
MKQSLNGIWTVRCESSPEKYGEIKTRVPGSVYSALIKAGKLDDPYFGENEYKSTPVCDDDYTFERSFDLNGQMKSADRILLKFYGIDTVSDVVLNGEPILHTENMHREWVCDVTDIIEEEGNILTVYLRSPNKFIAEKNAKTPLWGVSSTMEGYPHIRKAHYMFGWDWGPKLPDMGIWRNVELIGVKGGIIDSIYIRQDHSELDKGVVYLDIDAAVSHVTCGEKETLRLLITISNPDGKGGGVLIPMTFEKGETLKTIRADITDPKLWYPRGYGSQPLYGVKCELMLCREDGESEIVCTESMNIGLRTVTVSRTPDSEGDGEEFAFVVNGLKIFAMGANYIPEDHILSRTSAVKTEKLLRQCCMANFNMIRVWGGGYYPEDYFYDACDRMGLLVWQDLMFACSVYRADVEFCENVKEELADNIKRLRNHPSLAMWCGNNEIESAWQYWGIPSDEEYKKDYLRLFEALAPKVLAHYDPQTFYWPSSPSSGGSFNDSGADNKGDSHYWAVWHSLKPFTEYDHLLFRFCSEYGFESIPNIKTVMTFANADDLNITGPVMEAHQKCEAGSEKLLYYLAQMTHYPYDFEGLIYATQLVQADAVRLNVEHMRRNRGICMGSLYWQVNDSNPVISWSSIDYYHRWKALHYYAKKFYAPVLLSADKTDMNNILLNVSSELLESFDADVRWRIRNSKGDILRQGKTNVTVKPLCAENVCVLTREMTGLSPEMYRSTYLEYSLIGNGKSISSGTCLFVPPKAFSFADPKLKVSVTELADRFRITVSASAFAKGVFLDLKGSDCLFTDNWFDIHGGTVGVYALKPKNRPHMTAAQFKEMLTAVSYFDALGLTDKEEI